MKNNTFQITIGTHTWKVPVEHYPAVSDDITTAWRHDGGPVRIPATDGEYWVFVPATVPVVIRTR